jgi:hypothetical protein
MNPKPTAAAMRAGRVLDDKAEPYSSMGVETYAEIIDQETALPELVGALRSLLASKQAGERILASQWAAAAAALAKADGQTQ